MINLCCEGHAEQKRTDRDEVPISLEDPRLASENIVKAMVDLSGVTNSPYLAQRQRFQQDAAVCRESERMRQ